LYRPLPQAGWKSDTNKSSIVDTILIDVNITREVVLLKVWQMLCLFYFWYRMSCTVQESSLTCLKKLSEFVIWRRSKKFCICCNLHHVHVQLHSTINFAIEWNYNCEISWILQASGIRLSKSLLYFPFFIQCQHVRFI